MKNKLLIVLFVLSTMLNNAQPGFLDISFNPDDFGFGNGDGTLQNVKCSAIQSDGKILIGGNFHSFNGFDREGIARLNTNGTIDTTFNPVSGNWYNGDVNSIVIQNDGKIVCVGRSLTRFNIDGSQDNSFAHLSFGSGFAYDLDIQDNGKIIVVGSFEIGGYKNIFRVNMDGTLDNSFTGLNLELYHRILTVSIKEDGRIIIGGSFPFGLKCLLEDGNNDITFNAGTSQYDMIFSTYIQSDGKILIGGRFTSYAGVERSRIARLETDGAIDHSFDPGTGVNGVYNETTNVTAISVQDDGKILIGGFFTEYNGSERNNLARINSDGSLDTGFISNTGPVGTISISMQQNNKMIVSGNFTERKGVARLNSDGSLDYSFNRHGGANSTVYCSSIQSDDKILIGGYFTAYNDVKRIGLARLNSDGSIDSSFDPGSGVVWVPYPGASYTGSIYGISIQSDSKILVGGQFSEYNGSPAGSIARLNSDGSIDNAFNTGAGANGTVYATAVQSDGKIIVGGLFNLFSGTNHNNLVRLNANGTIDNSFNQAEPNGVVNCITVLNNGKILIAGAFTSVNGATKKGIALLSTDGALDESFDPGSGIDDDLLLSASVNSMVLQNDGKVLIGGAFTSYNGMPRNRIARLNVNGSLDTTFNPGAGFNDSIYTSQQSACIFTISVLINGKILAGGWFTSFNGTPVNHFACLNFDGSFDNSFETGAGFSSYVRSMSTQRDGRIILTGDFSSYNGIGKTRIARINSYPTEIKDRYIENKMIVFPNPSTGLFFLENQINKIGSFYRITGLDGKEIMHGYIQNTLFQVDLSQKLGGVYILSMENQTIKLIKI